MHAAMRMSSLNGHTDDIAHAHELVGPTKGMLQVGMYILERSMTPSRRYIPSTRLSHVAFANIETRCIWCAIYTGTPPQY